MSPQNKKRFNAFEDLGETAVKGSAPTNLSPAEPPALSPIAAVERIERLSPSQMIPDRFQPRRLLPPSIRASFFSGATSCYEAAAAWLELSKSDQAIKSEVERLVAMGDSFDEHGQIKPITGSWKEGASGNFIFQIETGERRFWAACLKKVKDHSSDEPILRIEVVDHPTRQRQVLENRHAEPPSAVEQACEIAALILAELNIQPDPTLEDEFEFFRLVRNQRMPTGLWERVTPIMQLTRPRMVQLLNILQLPNPLLDLADRYRLPERVLREVLAASKQHWEKLIQLSIQNQLTSDEVAGVPNLSESPQGTAPRPPTPPLDHSREAGRSLRRFVRSINHLDPVDQSQALDALADELVVLGQAEDVLARIDELARLIRVRLKRS